MRSCVAGDLTKPSWLSSHSRPPSRSLLTEHLPDLFPKLQSCLADFAVSVFATFHVLFLLS